MNLLEVTLVLVLILAGLSGTKTLSNALGKDFAEGTSEYKELSKWRK